MSRHLLSIDEDIDTTKILDWDTVLYAKGTYNGKRVLFKISDHHRYTDYEADMYNKYIKGNGAIHARKCYDTITMSKNALFSDDPHIDMTNRVDVLILEGLESWESLSTWLGTKYLKLTATNRDKHLKHLLLLVAQILRSFIEMGVAHNQLTSTKVLILADGDSFNVKIIDFSTGSKHA